MNSGFTLELNVPSNLKYGRYISEIYSDHLKRNMKASNTDIPEFSNKFKLVIHELFMNVVRNNITNQINSSLELNRESIKLTFSYKGTGFKLKPMCGKENYNIQVPPFGGAEKGKLFTLFRNDMDEVICLVKSPFNLEFMKRKRKTADKLAEIPEHFGMYIITSFSDRALYRKSGEIDTFEITRKL